MSSRVRKSKTPRREGSLWEQRLWDRVASPLGIGVILIVAGALLMVAPWGAIPTQPSLAWWSTAYQFTEAARASAVLAAFAAVLGLAALGYGIGALRGPARIQRIGVMIGVVGVMAGVAAWMAGQMSLPTSKVSLPANQTIEAFPAISIEGQFKVMLPNRVTVKRVDIANQAVTINVASAVDPEGEDRSLSAGDSLILEGHRWSLLGVEFDPRIPRVVMSSTDDNTIQTAGIRGQKLRFTPEGEEFEILRVSRNYLGAVGPAVELSSEKHGKFWVYSRARPLKHGVGTPGNLRVDGIESAPVAVLAVSSDKGDQWLTTSGIIFIVGFVMAMAVVGPRRRPHGDVTEEE